MRVSAWGDDILNDDAVLARLPDTLHHLLGTIVLRLLPPDQIKPFRIIWGQKSTSELYTLLENLSDDAIA